MDVSWGLKHTVGWETQTGELDEYAQPVFLPMGTIAARVNRKVQIVKNADGVDVVSNTRAHVLKPVLVGDKVTINDEAHYVISVDDGIALYGSVPSFYVLYL